MLGLVNSDKFLARHHTGIGKLLGITFPFAARHRVVAHLDIEPEHLASHGAVHGSVIMALADCASTYGAVLNLPSDRDTKTLEAKLNYLAAGTGNTLRAEATPLHVGQVVSVWRAVVFRAEQPVADVTQTQMTVQDDATENGNADPHMAQVGGQGRRAAGGGTPSGSFSTEIVDERWRQILEGASRVIAAKGFAKATIREIAAAAEMPVPTMYQYLAHKEDILYNIYKYFMTDIVAVLGRWRSNETPPRQRLVGAIRAMIDVFDKNHRFIKLMYQETRALTPEARRQVYELDAQYITIFRDLLSEAMRNGELRIRNAELAANFVYFLCTIWPLRFWSIGKYGEAAVTNEIVDFVLAGLGATAARDPEQEQRA
jgi:TetR/AcrR family transcriptional regulator, cholesterol catabolism regulator